MHTVWMRLNAVATFAGTVLAVLCVLVALTDKLHTANPACDVKLVSVDGLQKEFGSDRAWITMDVRADLRSLFTWNTKQLFVSVEVDFETEVHNTNQMMIWTSIVRTKESALIRKPELRPTFPFALTDHGTALRGRPFNVTVRWNTMPKVGALEWGSQTVPGFEMPDEYIRPSSRRY